MTQKTDGRRATEQEVVTVEGLTKRFGGLVAVDDLTFSLREGELMGMIGPNGAGKTTVFNILTGFHSPSSGTVMFDGQSLDGLEPHEVCRRGMSRTFQIPRPLADLSVRENAMVGAFLQDDDPQTARAIADDVLENLQFDVSYDTPAGDLPIASKKKLEVAKALATDPGVLLFDEVLAGLNTAEVEAFTDTIDRIHDDDLTILMIEHNVDVIMSLSDRVLVLDNGAKIALDEPEPVKTDPEVIEAYIGKE